MKTMRSIVTPIHKSLIAFLLFIPLSHGYIRLESKAIAKYQCLRASLTAYLLAHYTATPDLKNLVVTEARSKGLNPALVSAIVEKESGWNPAAVRHEPRLGTLSVGLFQILPSTAKACPGSPTREELFHPLTNIRCGIYLLSSYMEKTGSPRKTLVAFNGGEGCLTKQCSGAEAYASSVLSSFSESIL